MLKAVKEKGDFGTPYLLSTIGHNYTKASNFAQCKNKIFFFSFGNWFENYNTYRFCQKVKAGRGYTPCSVQI